MIFATKEHYTLIIDEFQEFDNINPSIFSEIQNLWDTYKDTARINFIVCGSIYSLMMRIFEDKKEPKPSELLILAVIGTIKAIMK